MILLKVSFLFFFVYNFDFIHAGCLNVFIIKKKKIKKIYSLTIRTQENTFPYNLINDFLLYTTLTTFLQCYSLLLFFFSFYDLLLSRRSDAAVQKIYKQ